VLYAIAAVVLFVNYYPVITGWPVSAASLHGSRWFWLSAWR
jgi:hypothetical protein